ncbi:MAG: class I SAM-dependent methyltransferase [Sphingopyxis sp.]
MSEAPPAADTLPDGDYVSPGLAIIRPDACFPHMVLGDAMSHPWPYLRKEVRHNWYVDERYPLMGFVSRDEAAILHNMALAFAGKRALEIGCWHGWSTCHLALGGVELDVIDPKLADAAHEAEFTAMLTCAGVSSTVRLRGGSSPAMVEQLAAAGCGPWALFFVDGDHEAPAPEVDVEACLPHAAPDCAFLFHEVASPHVAEGLRQLEACGFNVMLYQTMQIMAVAWRGRIQPIQHIPDPAVVWQLPHHLVGLPVSGVDLPSYAVGLRQKLAEQSAQVAQLQMQVAERDAAFAQAQRPSMWRRILGRL